jgi:hypothetical protein
MNIEQLEKGKKLRSQIDELNRTQTNLINNYKKGKTRQTVYVSFDGNHGEYYTIGEDAINQIFNLINGDLMKKITALETEFEHL